MIDIAELEQYFPKPNEPIKEDPYTFRITLSQDTEKDIFVVNLKIKQEDTKEDHLIKFRLGLGKDKKTLSDTHETNKPHFEVDIYKREKDSFSATIYFTFDESNDEKLMGYAKGTVVLISKIIESFLKNNGINKNLIEELVYEDAIMDELSSYEKGLIDALYECYKNSNLIVRQDGQAVVIKTPHNLSKYLNTKDLKPLYLPLFKKINEK
jgi:hypothetical protein